MYELPVLVKHYLNFTKKTPQIMVVIYTVHYVNFSHDVLQHIFKCKTLL